MSAIWGIIYKNNKFIEQPTVDAMRFALQNRATDGAGIYYRDNVLIGNSQLSTSVFQHNEPLPYHEDKYVITADARIDNRHQLISLLALPQKQAEIPDSMLIIEAYKKWGELCTGYLEGEFAFVIWNKQTQTLFAATDHMGFRSFYYHHSADGFIFSSEIKGILAVKKTPHHFNKTIIVDYLTANNSGLTFEKGIYALLGASHLLLSNDLSALHIKKYWVLKRQGKYQFTHDKDWADCLRELLIESITNRLNTDKATGVTFSGGLDSSFITAIAAIELQKKNKLLYTFSNVLPDNHIGPEKDEAYYINLMGKQYKNICQSFIQLPFDQGPFSDLEDTFEKTEALCYPFIYVDKALYAAAKERNVGTLFTGFGGDFTISNNGDSMVYDMLKEGSISNAVSYFNFLKRYYNLSFIKSLKLFIADYSSLRNLYAPLIKRLKNESQVRLNDELCKLVTSRSRFGGSGTIKRVFSESVNTGTLGGVLYNTQKKLGANYGIDCAVPIFDKNISEFFLDVPPEQFLLNGQRRSLIKRAMEGIVPPEIQQRDDKMAFSPDFFRRFKQQGAYMHQVLNTNYSENVWQFINKKDLLKDIDHLLKAQASEVDTAMGRTAAWGIGLTIFIHWLERKEFLF